MTCEQLSSILAEQPLDHLPAATRAEADAHLAGCENCRALLESIDGIRRAAPAVAPPVPADLSAVRPMPSAAVFISLAMLAPLLFAVLSMWWWNGSAGWNALPLASKAIGLVLAAVGLAALSVGFYHQFKPGSGAKIDGRVAATALFVAYGAFVLFQFPWRPAPGWDLDDALSCFQLGCKVALVAAVALFALARLGFAPKPSSAGFLTGALASMAGLMALTLLCPYHEVSHLFLGHATVIIAISAVIALIGQRLLNSR